MKEQIIQEGIDREYKKGQRIQEGMENTIQSFNLDNRSGMDLDYEAWEKVREIERQ